MKRSNLFLTVLLAFFTITGLNAQAFGVDYNISGSPTETSFTGQELIENSDNGTVVTIVNGVTFSLSGSTTLMRARDRGMVPFNPSDVLRDFAFLNDGVTTFTLQISDLTANQEYTINSYHLAGNDTNAPIGELDFPARMSVELKENGTTIAGGAQIIDNNPGAVADDPTTSAFLFTATAGATYTIECTSELGADGGTRNRFNGVLVTPGNILSVNDFSEELASSDLKVSPNPFRNSFSIDFDAKTPFSKVVIYDVLGQAVKTFNADSDMSQITLNGSAGIYFLSLYNGSTLVANKKLIKQ